MNLFIKYFYTEFLFRLVDIVTSYLSRDLKNKKMTEKIM